MRVYIAGPMRGYPQYNFPAFDAAKKNLELHGHFVISPADLDRANGFTEDSLTPDAEWVRAAMRRDIAALATCDAICLLPGWRDSEGALLEHSVAVACGLIVFDGQPETVCQEADRLVNGARRASYGHPLDDYRRTAAIWSAILGHAVTPQQAVMCMIGVKLSRECNRPKRDNRADMAGYAACLDLIQERINAEEKPSNE